MKYSLLHVLVGAWLGVLAAACGRVQESSPDAPLPSSLCADGTGTQATQSSQMGIQFVGCEREVPFLLTGTLGSTGNLSKEDSAEKVRDAVDRIAPMFGLTGAALHARRATVDERGHRHLRFQQILQGLPVVGGEFVLHLDAEGTIYAANSSACSGPLASDTPALSPELAVARALANTTVLGAKTFSEPRRVYLCRPGSNVPQLAYEVRLQGSRQFLPADDLVYVDALRGGILTVYPRIHALLNRAVHSAAGDIVLPGTLVRGEGAPPTGDSHVDEHYAHLGTTYTCFRENFGRDSYDGAGARIVSTVHFGAQFVNAFWDGNQLAFGDGDGAKADALGKALDVTAHEFTHGVTASESNLAYVDESGGLNEAMSDILGAFCESWSRQWTMDADTWRVGEAFWTPATQGDAMRYMDDPARDGQSLDFYPDYMQGVDVHYSSGIANLAFRLLATGGSHPRGKTRLVVPGLGMRKAGYIFYRANTDWMTPSTTFAQARAYTEQVAQQLGEGPATVLSVTRAWQAVGVGTAPVPSGPPTASALDNNVPATGLSGSSGNERAFFLQVPEGTAQLTVTLGGGSGDADLYVKHGTSPTSFIFDCRPYQSGNEEACVFSNPLAGTWHILVRGHVAFSDVTLRASLVSSADLFLQSHVPVGNLAATAGSERSWMLVVPPGTAELSISISGGSGDADLYVRHGLPPTLSAFTCRAIQSGSTDRCVIQEPRAGTWHVMLHSYVSYKEVSLLAALQISVAAKML